MADDGMQLASVRNGNSYVQMALHARPVSACEDKKLHGKNGDKHLEGEGGKNCLPEGYHMSGWLKRLPQKYNYKPGLAVTSIPAITDFVRVTRI